MTNFRTIILGLGVQGQKRKKIADTDVVCVVDPFKKDADFKEVTEVPLDSFDSALVCTPDEAKIDIINYLVENKKHVLVEKPLWSSSKKELIKIQQACENNKVICYTAYNHRFEPHFVRMKETLDSGLLGNIYSCRVFYGNGTATLVKNSEWRDKGAGVLNDLGSHLLDTYLYWFNEQKNEFKIIASNKFENKSYDHIVLSSELSKPRIELEMTLLMWRNHFTCDVLGERGSAHIESLCKWGPSKFILRKRIMPSGRPPEEVTTLIQDDPTWEQEYAYFRKICMNKVYDVNKSNLNKDIWLQETLTQIASEAEKK